MKESGPDRECNTRDIKCLQKIAHKLPDVVDLVHRLGQRGDGRHRVIIIQFAIRLYRDIQCGEMPKTITI